MLSRFIVASKTTRHFRTLYSTLSPSSSTPSSFPHKKPIFLTTRHFSSSNNGGNNNNFTNGGKPTSDFWKMSQDSDQLDSNLFGEGEQGERKEDLPQRRPEDEKGWGMTQESGGGGGGGDLDVFGDDEEGFVGEIERKRESGVRGQIWSMSGGGGDKEVEEVLDVIEEGRSKRENGVGMGGLEEQWSMEDDEGGNLMDVFETGDVDVDVGGFSVDEGGGGGGKVERFSEVVDGVNEAQVKKEEEALMAVLKGPNRAFGDLVASSGITDDMLDSLIALKDFKDIQGLPPLTQIEDERYFKSLRKSSRYEMELQKQEDAAKSRVRQVDEKGRAYGTGRRKCSIARVWLEPGEGKFSINDKEFDVYFPMLDHRAALLRPFAETKTLGLWDIKSTVKGGGVSGQVGALRLGISRALQNWEPGLRPPLREAGFLSRDPRVVERKKPGKAKARKSFQWVKR